jgi:hypothetical protein
VLSPLYPFDKAANASGKRRRKDHQQALDGTLAFLRPQRSVLSIPSCACTPSTSPPRSALARPSAQPAASRQMPPPPSCSVSAGAPTTSAVEGPSGDSNLYLRRIGQQLLSIEHRAARLALTLKADPPALALEVHTMSRMPLQPFRRVATSASNEYSPPQVALMQKQSRDAVRLRIGDVGQALAALVADGSVLKSLLWRSRRGTTQRWQRRHEFCLVIAPRNPSLPPLCPPQNRIIRRSRHISHLQRTISPECLGYDLDTAFR